MKFCYDCGILLSLGISRNKKFTIDKLFFGFFLNFDGFLLKYLTHINFLVKAFRCEKKIF